MASVSRMDDREEQGLAVAEGPRAALAELVAQIRGHFGHRLVGLYLFGSLVTGGFHPGRSDLDVWAVLSSSVAEGDELDSLRILHERFEEQRPAWRDRIEVLYVGRDVLQTFASKPTGRVARISPGEPMHHRELGGDIGWLLDWHSVVTAGETLFGPQPLIVGPPVADELFRKAVKGQLDRWRELVRQDEVEHVPAQQGYIVATVSRALYTLTTGKQTSKKNAVAWLAKRSPELAEFLWASYDAYRTDNRDRHHRLIRFVDDAWDEAARLAKPPRG